MREVLKSQISKYGFPVFFNKSQDSASLDFADVEDIFIDKLVDFAKGREDLILKRNEYLNLEDISSECYIRPTKDMQSFAVVKTHMVTDPTILNLYAFSIIKWRGEFHLLQVGKLFAKTKNIAYDGSLKKIANISWIDTIETKIQDYEDDYAIFATNSRERNYALSNISSFAHSINIDAENKGIGRTLLDAFDSLARRTKIDYAILESVPKLVDLIDHNGNIVREEEVLVDKDGVVIAKKGEPVRVDVNTDIFYTRQGFIKADIQSKSGGEYMYKPYRPAYSSETPDNLKILFESFNYQLTQETSNDPLDCNFSLTRSRNRRK